jgi:hypothetical protein
MDGWKIDVYGCTSSSRTHATVEQFYLPYELSFNHLCSAYAELLTPLYMTI